MARIERRPGPRRARSRAPAASPRKLGAVTSVMPRRSAVAGKLERIDQLARHGLNTPRIMLIPLGSPFDDELRTRMRELAAGDARMTVRTYHPSDEITYAKGPFAPEVPIEDAMLLAEEFAGEWNVLFQEAIDVDATLLAGNVALSADGAGAFEALAGRYRVREVEDPPVGAEADIRSGEFAHPAEIDEPQVRDAVQRVLDSGVVAAVAPRGQILLELNAQSEPVGRRHELLLFWEWRPLPSPTGGYGQATRVVMGRQHGGVIGVGVPGLPPPPDEASFEPTLGGKGAGLARAFAAGLPVPPFLVLDATDPMSPGPLHPDRRVELDRALRALTAAADDFFGDRDRSARRLAVRSSPAVSMPGMLDTVLQVEPNGAAVATAVRRVLSSWNSDRAREYRRTHAISEHSGLAVVLQPMVDATGGDRAGSGVGFTRHPTRGDPYPEVEYVEGEQGHGLVGGDALPLATREFSDRWPDLFGQLLEWCPVLERIQGDAQEFEFTFECGRGCLLQTRRAKRTAVAAVRIAHDLVQDGVIDLRQAREALLLMGCGRCRRTPSRQRWGGRGGSRPHGVPGGGGGARGIRCRWRRTHPWQRRRRHLLMPDPEPLRLSAAAPLRSRSLDPRGITSHASVVALDAGIVAVVGCRSLEVIRAERAAAFGDVVVAEGDWLSVEAAPGGAAIYAGRLPEEGPSLPPGLSQAVVNWARDLVRGL